VSQGPDVTFEEAGKRAAEAKEANRVAQIAMLAKQIEELTAELNP
jgi:hypothetical protein